ncbi:MAG: hypothetical protein LBS19_10245 [Clostridiales bacterium]|jgi:alpha-mannosidase|nr:hypothetical protein [Clostridiales bacterium]
MSLQFRVEQLCRAPAGPMGRRTLAELRYVLELDEEDLGDHGGAVLSAIDILEAGLAADGVLTDSRAKQAEDKLLPLAAAAKRYTVLCAGHAHIDMNWMWRYDETVSITLDTFRTVLSLMDEYPDFRFSQSQASVYRIVEEHDPDMLAQIKRRVAEGRWELSASTWVEADRNMPSGESVARHLLYAKKYLKYLLGAKDDDFLLDFEPDTFGHGVHTPELLAAGGVKYYYHCRGSEGEALYRWQSPSGAGLLCYRDPFWYLGPVEAGFALGVPSFCKRYGVDAALRVYGVGDHGGGPTRRDIERLMDMAGWPVFPNIRFGTYKEFFERVSKANNLPVVKSELNPVFTGCYTSQARIKQANRFGEAKLDEAERFAAAAASLTGFGYRSGAFEGAWRKILFNQFHDILPGSGIIDTREHAMGLFQQAIAAADTQKAGALRALGALADTGAFITGESAADSASEGAGVGFGLGYGMTGVSPTVGLGSGQPFRVAQTNRGSGLNRVFHVFNPSPVPRTEIAELTVFDWQGDWSRVKLMGPEGALRFQVLDESPKEFFLHSFVRVLAEMSLPAGGRATCVMGQDENIQPFSKNEPYPRLEKPHSCILENVFIKAVFCPDTGALLSLTDKTANLELLHGPSAFFRLIEEQPAENTAGTSWTVGRYRRVTDMTADVEIRRTLTGSLKNAITIVTRVGASSVAYTVSLAEGSRWLDIDCDADWREAGIPWRCTPQLNFTLPLAMRPDDFIHNVPGGLLRRAPVNQDMPCQSFAAAQSIPGRAVMLISDSKYGFRCENTPNGCAMSLNCLRSSTDPDPTPEYGRHRFRIGIGVSEDSGLQLVNTAYAFCHPPLVISDRPRNGSLPMKQPLIQADGAFLQAVKQAEDGNAVIMRLMETEGRDGEAVVSLWADIHTAVETDAHEQPVRGQAITIDGSTLRCKLRAHSTVHLRVTLK